MNSKTIISLLVILILGAGIYFISSKKTGSPIQQGCTEEAKICSDGSSVGRSGPKCEFAACPMPPGWKTYTDTKNGVSYQYPIKLETEYISTVDWPPILQITNESFTCNEAGSEIERAGETKKVTINGNVYCVTKIVEGAAGTMYTQYAYAFPKDDKTFIFTFTIKAVQCANYDDPKKSECEMERSAFNIDDTIDMIRISLQ